MKTQPLLRVEHLCQYFRSGGATLKAVDDVSFEIGKAKFSGSSARAVAEKPLPGVRLSGFTILRREAFISRACGLRRARILTATK